MLISCALTLITIYCKKKYHWWELEDALIYGYKYKDLGDSLILYPFSRIIVLGSLVLSTRWYQAWVLSCGTGFKFDQKVVGYIRIMPLFHQWAYLARPIITVAYRGHGLGYMRPFQERKKWRKEGRLEERNERRGEKGKEIKLIATPTVG